MSQPRVLSSDIPAAGRCLGSCREQIKLHDLNKGKGQYKKKKKYIYKTSIKVNSHDLLLVLKLVINNSITNCLLPCSMKP